MTKQKNERNNSSSIEIFNKVSDTACDPNDFDFYINIYFDEIIQYIKTDILQSNLKNLQEQERTIKKIAQKIDLFEQEQLKTSYQLGVLKSIISLSQKYKIETKKCDLDFYVEKLEQNHKLCQMIIILYDRNSIKHQDLANMLNITKSALSNMVKKTQDLELYSIKRHGKFKYYYSNFKTKEVYRKYNDKNTNQICTQSKLDNVVSNIFIILSEEIKNNRKINYSSIINRLPYNFTPLPKSVVSSIENFVREYNYNISNDYSYASMSLKKTFEIQQYKNISIARIQEENDL